MPSPHELDEMTDETLPEEQAIEPLGWDEYEFHDNVMHRIGAVTKEQFSADVLMWEAGVRSLEPYTERVMREEVLSMDFSIPSQFSFDLAELFACYSRLTAFRERLAHMISTASKHVIIFEAAEGSLEKSAKGLFNSGTIKDKEAAAAHVVQPFTMALARARAFVLWLEKRLKALEFNAAQLEMYLKERQSARRTNYTYEREGDAINFEQPSQPPSHGHTRQTYKHRADAG